MVGGIRGGECGLLDQPGGDETDASYDRLLGAGLNETGRLVPAVELLGRSGDGLAGDRFALWFVHRDRDVECLPRIDQIEPPFIAASPRSHSGPGEFGGSRTMELVGQAGQGVDVDVAANRRRGSSSRR